MVQNILLATLNSPTHPQLTSPTSSSSSPEWLSNPKKLKRILICDPFKDNVDRTLERMKEVLGSHTGVEVGVVESESRACGSGLVAIGNRGLLAKSILSWLAK